MMWGFRRQANNKYPLLFLILRERVKFFCPPVLAAEQRGEYVKQAHPGVLQQIGKDREHGYPGGDRKPCDLACDSALAALLAKPVAGEKPLIHSCRVLLLGHKHKVLESLRQKQSAGGWHRPGG